MKAVFRAIICGGILLSPGYAKISLVFLGVKSEQEPLLKNELERQIFKEFRTLSNYKLKPKQDVDLLYERGILKAPEIGAKRSSILAKRLDSRILSFGKLNRMEMVYHRNWFMPWRGSVELSHSMWFKVIDADDGSIKFSGELKVNNTVSNKHLGWEPTLGKMDPILRDEQLTILVGKLAIEARDMLLASIKGLEEEIPEDKKTYDPAFFENQRVEREQKEGAKLKESEVKSKVVKPKPVYTKSLFRPPRPKKAVDPKKDDLSRYELKEDELEIIEEDPDLMDDVNLMEGM